jgi:hypothetical protein
MQCFITAEGTKRVALSLVKMSFMISILPGSRQRWKASRPDIMSRDWPSTFPKQALSSTKVLHTNQKYLLEIVRLCLNGHYIGPLCTAECPDASLFGPSPPNLHSPRFSPQTSCLLLTYFHGLLLLGLHILESVNAQA